jgi:hypothetical protein
LEGGNRKGGAGEGGEKVGDGEERRGEHLDIYTVLHFRLVSCGANDKLGFRTNQPPSVKMQERAEGEFVSSLVIERPRPDELV